MACNVFLTLPGGKKMPALGYGTWQSSGESLEEALEAALEAGYRHIDTAQRYQNEDVVGKVLKRWFDSGKLKREDVFITTKLSATVMHPDKVEESLRESLEKLQMDYVDLYLIHFPMRLVFAPGNVYADDDVDYLDVWKKMEEQYQAGRAKAIGVSNFSIKKISRILDNCQVKPANNQVEMHVYFQQRELVDFCTKNGITVVAYSPLGCRAYNTLMEKLKRPMKELPDLLNDEAVKAIAQKHAKTSVQVLLRFLVQVGVAAIPKSINPERIKDNFNIFDFSLDEEEMKTLRGLDRGEKGRVVDFKDFGEKLAAHPDFEF